MAVSCLVDLVTIQSLSRAGLFAVVCPLDSHKAKPIGSIAIPTILPSHSNCQKWTFWQLTRFAEWFHGCVYH